MVNVMWYGHRKNLYSSTGFEWLLDVPFTMELLVRPRD